MYYWRLRTAQAGTVANPEHLVKLLEGVEAWNQWRDQNFGMRPDLSGAGLSRARLGGAKLNGADLNEVDFSHADLREARLTGADLREANLREAMLFRVDLAMADLRGADLRGAGLIRAFLDRASLSGATLHGADLRGADLRDANLKGADLEGANLIGSSFINANLEAANLTGCLVYGISAWNVKLKGAIQSSLRVTPLLESPIQVDNLEVAQFIYLLLNNEKIRSVIETITSKVVLTLGRFTPDRIVVLDAIRDELRKRDYLPVLFDFEKPSSQTTVETISTLAHMARFVIADLTDAKSVLQELQAIVPLSPSVVVQPLLLASQEEPGMFDFIRNFRGCSTPTAMQTSRRCWGS
jgi:uncharacterized protein YjbI with pentapeptide repeats